MAKKRNRQRKRNRQKDFNKDLLKFNITEHLYHLTWHRLHFADVLDELKAKHILKEQTYSQYLWSYFY